MNLAGRVWGKVKEGVFLHPWDTMQKTPNKQTKKPPKKQTNKKKNESDCQRKQGKHINFNMKPSTYFPESLPEGCVEGTLGALCNDNVKTDNQNVEGKTYLPLISF